MSVLKTRGYQLFPVLDRSQIDTAKRFASAPEREFTPGELVYNAGKRDVPTWLVLKGSISVVRRDGLNHETAITSLGPGSNRHFRHGARRSRLQSGVKIRR